MIKHPDLNWTIITSTSFLAMGLLIVFLISINIVKKKWVQDNKLLKSIGMVCNSDQDINFSSLKIWKNYFVSSSVIFSSILTAINILVTILMIYFYNGHGFQGVWTWFSIAMVLPLIYLSVQFIAIFLFLKKYTNNIRANDLIKFLQKYKPHMKNESFELNQVPRNILWRINHLKTKDDILIQALLIASKYHSYNWHPENTEKAHQLFDYILINKQ